MEIENAIFKDLESFGKERGLLKCLFKSFELLFGKILKKFQITKFPKP